VWKRVPPTINKCPKRLIRRRSQPFPFPSQSPRCKESWNHRPVWPYILFKPGSSISSAGTGQDPGVGIRLRHRHRGRSFRFRRHDGPPFPRRRPILRFGSGHVTYTDFLRSRGTSRSTVPMSVWTRAGALRRLPGVKAHVVFGSRRRWRLARAFWTEARLVERPCEPGVTASDDLARHHPACAGPERVPRLISGSLASRLVPWSDGTVVGSRQTSPGT
jgi:hypothetical protein